MLENQKSYVRPSLLMTTEALMRASRVFKVFHLKKEKERKQKRNLRPSSPVHLQIQKHLTVKTESLKQIQAETWSSKTHTCTSCAAQYILLFRAAHSPWYGIMASNHGPLQACHSCYILNMQDFSFNNITRKVFAQFKEEYFLASRNWQHAAWKKKENILKTTASGANVQTSMQQTCVLLYKGYLEQTLTRWPGTEEPTWKLYHKCTVLWERYL